MCSIGFHFLREKEYKSELLSAQLQLYNRQLLRVAKYAKVLVTRLRIIISPKKSQSAFNSSFKDGEYGIAVRTITLSPLVAE